MRVFRSPDEVAAATGEDIGPSDWLTITQALIDAFAELTEDRQWIHVDTDRAADGPFGGTVAHGYLLESLIPRFSAELLRIDGITSGVNMGSDRTRFLSPVTAGSRIRARARILEATAHARGTRVAIRFTYDVEGVETPAMISDTVRLVTT